MLQIVTGLIQPNMRVEVEIISGPRMRRLRLNPRCLPVLGL